MNDLATDTLADNITTSITAGDISSCITGDISDCIQSITNRCSSIYYNPFGVPYDSCNNYTITTSAWPTKLETDSNELKINIKKFQIKFNFNL